MEVLVDTIFRKYITTVTNNNNNNNNNDDNATVLSSTSTSTTTELETIKLQTIQQLETNIINNDSNNTITLCTVYDWLLLNRIFIIHVDSNPPNDDNNTTDTRMIIDDETSQQPIIIITTNDAYIILELLLLTKRKTTTTTDSIKQNENNNNDDYYLLQASISVKNTVQLLYKQQEKLLSNSNSKKNTNPIITIPITLLNIIVQQMITSYNVQVSTNCLQSIIIICQYIVLFSDDNTTNDNCRVMLNTIFTSIVHYWTTNNTILDDDTKTTKLLKNTASTIIVRCCTSIVDIIIIGCIPTVQTVHVETTNTSLFYECIVSSNILNVFLQQINSIPTSTDPLLSLSIMDIVEQFVTKIASILVQETKNFTMKRQTIGILSTSTMSNNQSLQHFIGQWLCTNDITIPILQLAGCDSEILDNDPTLDTDTSSNMKTDDEYFYEPDPIVGTTALRIVSHMCRIYVSLSILLPQSQPATCQLILNFYRILQNYVLYMEEQTTVDDIDKLSYVDAISSYCSLSSQSLQEILSSNNTKLCTTWLCIQHIGQPQRKAAILISLSNVLQNITNNATTTDSETTTNATSNSTSLGLTAKDGIDLLIKFGTVNDFTIPSIIDSSNNTNTNTNKNGTNTCTIATTILSSMYNNLSTITILNNVTLLLLTLAKSSIDEIRIASYVVLQSICHYISTPTSSIGCIVLFSNINFYTNFLLLYNTSDTKEGKEIKYSIVQSIMEHYNKDKNNNNHTNTFFQLLSKETITELQTYIQRGPYYKPTLTWDVAVE